MSNITHNCSGCGSAVLVYTPRAGDPAGEAESEREAATKGGFLFVDIRQDSCPACGADLHSVEVLRSFEQAKRQGVIKEATMLLPTPLENEIYQRERGLGRGPSDTLNIIQ